MKKTLITALALTGALLAGRASGDLIEHYNTGADSHANAGGALYSAQTFTIGNTGPNEDFNLDNIRLKLYRYPTGAIGNMTIGIKNVNERGEPTGDFLTSQTIDGTILPTAFPAPTAGTWFNFDNLNNPLKLTASTQYAIQVSTDGDWAIGKWVADQYSSTYGGGDYFDSYNAGATWGSHSGIDAYFEIYGTPTNGQPDVIPEPATLGLLGSGLIGLLASKRRKKK